MPPVNDPVLEAYRQRNNYAYTPPPPPPPAAPAVLPASQPSNESEGLKKSSLVFVRNTTSETPTNARQSMAQPAYIERKGVSKLLPTGSRLVARLQNSVSSAVKTPVIAVIEYNYEQGGEILIPVRRPSASWRRPVRMARLAFALRPWKCPMAVLRALKAGGWVSTTVP